MAVLTLTVLTFGKSNYQRCQPGRRCDVFRKYGGIVSRAAHYSGLSERNVHEKLKRYGIYAKGFRDPVVSELEPIGPSIRDSHDQAGLISVQGRGAAAPARGRKETRLRQEKEEKRC